LLTRAASGFGDLHERNPVELELAVDDATVAFDAILHRVGNGQLLIELEPASGPRPFSFPNTYLAVRGTVAELNRATALSELYDITARAVRELTGFDRVMVYRYDRDYNGEVVAEDKRADLNSFLGQHYPASDIPAQARALYEKNWIRLISDVNYVPSPLVPVTGAPIDLTYSTLRSVSPIHIEYLQNMGVGASMSISLLRDGKLWGLIACHHYSGEHTPPYSVRAAAEFLGSTLSLRLVDRVEEQELRARIESQAILAKLTSAMLEQSLPIADGLLDAPSLLDLISADGIALDIEGHRQTRGLVPDAAQLSDLARWVTDQGSEVVATDSLGIIAPELGIDPETASGLLALALRDGQYVFWFRAEERVAVDWGGDPHNKAIATQQGDDVRLSPRKSFERWREIVSMRSLPWTDVEQGDAASLRRHVVEALYVRSEREQRLAETLQRSLLPTLPTVPGWQLSARYEPAAGGRIGGDWYDAFALQDGQLILIVGDVAGHGISAAGTMAQLRNVLRAYLVDGVTPAGAVERLNDFIRLMMPGAFATVMVASVHIETGAVDAVLAGHPRPLVSAPGARPAQPDLAISPPVGVPGASYRSTTFTLDPGGVLVLFSDGLIERRDEDLVDGLDRLAAAIGELGAKPTANTIFPGVLASGSDDDATIVVLVRPRA
jgi:chemotaxis family two-component system sensor kinase Cph1